METKPATGTKSSKPALPGNGCRSVSFFNTPPGKFSNTAKIMNMPAVNVQETGTTCQLAIAAAGLEKKDFRIECAGGMLTITAEREEETSSHKQEGRYNRQKYNFSSWGRSFSLPEDAYETGITAAYKKGELTNVIAHKAQRQADHVKKITIN